ncbi:dUTP diphosphatase [Aquibacillus salsiterrae]|uniref:dUTP diphosphatase n=1 Tax=Aquibacillus salsiterrae TaxID=2950439 RepID=A0A9X3WBL2_9BACI|nr:dUTP diphosphatase [Aquibacillus salsiterrae]MDC3415723.1 dUTP diphosphatase [Aquibacillus salsiterrae]
MNWKQLFDMQKQLDNYIQANHQLVNSDLFDQKVLALLVEIGELANETRVFKFWSNKAPSEMSQILEEYVDGLHFILSLGIEKGFQNIQVTPQPSNNNLTDMFNEVFEEVIVFKQKPSKENYSNLFTAYLTLGKSLSFDESSIQQAYFDKNKVNHQRQDTGY